MGNHFRTSGAGDDAPKTQPGAAGTRFATPDSEDQLFSPIPAQPADQAQPASDPFAYNPTNDVELSEAAGFEPVQKVTARVDQPRRTLSRRSLSWPVFPIPWLLRLRRHSLRSPVFLPVFPILRSPRLP